MKVARFRDVKSRIRKIFLHSDLHATRFALATAELSILGDLLCHTSFYSKEALLKTLPLSAWFMLLGCTGAAQLFFVLRGFYHDPDAVVFAGWNALLWIFMTSIIFNLDGLMPGPQISLTVAAAWVFVRSGFPIYGNRSTDDNADPRIN